jgi:hypothetical protein
MGGTSSRRNAHYRIWVCGINTRNIITLADTMLLNVALVGYIILLALCFTLHVCKTRKLLNNSFFVFQRFQTSKHYFYAHNHKRLSGSLVHTLLSLTQKKRSPKRFAFPYFVTFSGTTTYPFARANVTRTPEPAVFTGSAKKQPLFRKRGHSERFAAQMHQQRIWLALP